MIGACLPLGPTAEPTGGSPVAAPVPRPAAGCWSGLPPADVLAALSAIPGAGPGGPLAFQAAPRWTQTANDPPVAPGTNLQGEPVTLTYSFVPDGTPIASGGFGDLPATSDLFAAFDGLFGTTTTWQGFFHQSFQRWTALSGITFVHEPMDDGVPLANDNQYPGVVGVRGDIRIGGKDIDGATGINLLAFNYFPNVGDMVVDTTNTLFFGDPAQDHLRLRNVIAHEIGHAAGLRHVCPYEDTKLMEPVFSTVYDGPRLDDRLGVQRHYGDRLENDDGPSEANDLGLAAGGSTTLTELSIDGATDEDWFRLAATGPTTLGFLLRPVGTAYLEGSEQPGSCAGTLVNTAVLQDLAVELRGQDGALLLTTFDAGSAGEDESTVCEVLDPADGPFHLVVRGDGTDAVQAYELTVTTSSAVIRVPADQPTIQAAIGAACDGEIILVAPGIYTETLALGGRSVTIRGEAGAEATIIGHAPGAPLCSFEGIYLGSGPGSGPVLEDLTIVGDPQAFSNTVLTGISSTATLRRCVFDSDGGVGWNLDGGHLTLEDCRIEGQGTTVYLQQSALVVMRDCRALSQVAGAETISFTGDGCLDLARCRFEGGSGALIDLYAGSLSLSRCSIIGRSGTAGAFGPPAVISLSSGTFGVPGQHLLVNCLIAGNETGTGAVLVVQGSGASAEVVHCTIVDNPGTGAYGALEASGGASVTVSNSVLWGNVPTALGGAPSIQYSDVEAGDGMGGPWPGPGNILAPPDLIPLGPCRWHPASGSPAVDAGDASLSGLPAVDLAGNPRILGASVDLGAYEGAADCPYPGTLEDLALETGDPAGLDDAQRKAIAVGGPFVVSLSSPSGLFAGSLFALGGALLAPAAPTPSLVLPGLWLDPAATFILAGLDPGSPLGPQVLPTEGFSAGYFVPPSLVGARLLLQGVGIGPQAANGFFATTDAHELTFLSEL